MRQTASETDEDMATLPARLKGWLAGLDPLAILFPPSCPACGRRTLRHRALCAPCWASVHFIEKPYCAVLGRPFNLDLGEDILSADAIANPPAFDRARAAVIHTGPARNLVHGLKYNDRTDLALMMGSWMVRAAGTHLASADAIVPLPLHAARLFSRQYNQAAELARAIAAQSGIRMLPAALKRKKATRRQVGLSRNARQDNVSGAFVVPEEALAEIAGRHIVLVDDVLTTGATAGAATRALKRAGAREVTVLTFAMAVPDTI